MDRNTILAIVLSVIVITVGMTINMVFFPQEMMQTETTEAVASAPASSGAKASTAAAATPVGEIEEAPPFTVETGAYTMTFDPKGAQVTSIKLNNHLESTGEPVEVMVGDDTGKGSFLLYFDGDYSDPVDDYFAYSVSETDTVTTVDFTRDYEIDGSAFRVTKRFALAEADEYLFRVNVEMASLDGSPVPVSSYSVGYENQVGPSFVNLTDNYGDYRRISWKEVDGNNVRNISRYGNDGTARAEESVGWVALSGKYFAVIGVPAAPSSVQAVYYNDTSGEYGLSQRNAFYFERGSITGTAVSDTYSYYAGPKLKGELDVFNRAQDNTFGLADMRFEEVLDSSWLGWLQTILRWVLNFFYRIIPNYGVAIILLTILVKLLIQPISKKGMESTAKMSALSPKLEELKVKYADDPNALNAAMAKLYKDEGISPMGSCLPMMIQFPIFIALYGLLNTHYELRGAMFIPGWITDLSAPDTVATLPFSIPFLGNQVHLLPIIYTASMILSMKITQTTSTQSSQAGMMKFMTYGMPIIFFFVLYNSPSGLLVYWTVTNLISIAQQVFVNKRKKGQYAAEIQAKDEEKAAKKLARKRK